MIPQREANESLHEKTSSIYGGYETQQFGDRNNVTVQLKHESTLRTITGFNKALAISMQRFESGTFVLNIKSLSLCLT